MGHVGKLQHNIWLTVQNATAFWRALKLTYTKMQILLSYDIPYHADATT